MTHEFKPGDKAYITKYAVSRKGEAEEVVVKSVSEGGYVYVDGWYQGYKVGRDVAATPEEADTMILAAIEKKIAQVHKQLKSLEKIKVNVDSRIGKRKKEG